MAKSEGDDLFTLTAPALLSHPAIFEAKAFIPKGMKTPPAGQEPKYSGNFVFEATSEDLKGLKALAAKVARAKWPAPFPLSDLAFPFQDGTKVADKQKAEKKNDKGEFQRGKAILIARSKFPPRISYLENGKIVDAESDAQIAIAKTKIFFGAEVLAQFRFVTHPAIGGNKQGVNCYLQMILATGKGTKMAGGQSAAEAFKGYVGHATDEDPTGGNQGIDDDIPF